MSARVGASGVVDRRPPRRPARGVPVLGQPRGYVAVNPSAGRDGLGRGGVWPVAGSVRIGAAPIESIVQLRAESDSVTVCLYLTAYEAAGLADLLTSAAADARIAGGR